MQQTGPCRPAVPQLQHLNYIFINADAALRSLNLDYLSKVRSKPLNNESYPSLDGGGRGTYATGLLLEALSTKSAFAGSPVVSFKQSAFNNGATKLGESGFRVAGSF